MQSALGFDLLGPRLHHPKGGPSPVDCDLSCHSPRWGGGTEQVERGGGGKGKAARKMVVTAWRRNGAR